MGINRYLVYPPPAPGDLPARVYALTEALEGGEGQPWFVGLDAIDADFFDNARESQILDRWGDAQARRDFFERARLFGIELVHDDPKSLFNNEPRWAERSEHEWLELTIAGAGAGLPATLYQNLFGEGQAISLSSVRTAAPIIQAALNATDPLGPISDASDQTVEQHFGSASATDFVAVYDVGQGNMNALCNTAGRPLLYYDMGGGIQGNAKTFPKTAFTTACFAAPPPIVLSHWDKDHWSSANIFLQAHNMTWIVPRQAPLGKSHGALIQSITQYGTLLVWSPAGGQIKTSDLTLVVGTGSGRNHSGLNLIVHPANTANEILLPGDAAYRYVPGVIAKSMLSIVASHHGGTLPVPGVPASIGAGHSRLAYSVGSSNTYGHPTSTAQLDHQNAGWSASLVRDTRNRTAAGYGHISLHWRHTNRVPTVSCQGCGTNCDLKIQQN